MSVYSARHSVTPSSILKKTSTFKSRLSQVSSTPSKVRFSLPHAKKVSNILRDYKAKKNVKEFENLVCLIRDSELIDSDISSLLKEATECISLMNQDLRLFVEALLTISWVDKDKSVVKEYQSFIINLISAHNYHAEFVIGKLVRLFIPGPTEPEWPDAAPSKIETKKLSHVHSLLNLLLAVVPMCKEVLKQTLINQFPYLKKSTHIHEYYLHNLLWVSEYQPSLRPDILHLIFSKLVTMDVNAPREEIERLYYEDENIFPMEDDSKSTTTTAPNVNDTAHTLDVCLNKMLDYLISESYTNDELDWEKVKSLYQHVLGVFDKIILPTYNTHHVQFVMFVICTFKPAITEAFINYLWKKVVNLNVGAVLRQASVNYIVSFAARASFVPLTMVKGTLQQMADWIHSYINFQDGLDSVNSDVRAHTVFYSVCQGLFYLVAFRHQELVSSRKNIVFLESLNLAKMVTCRLNPLRVCQPAVVQNFAAFTRQYQLAYCYSVIEHNSRNTLPTLYRDEKGAVSIMNSILEAYYPFDPYVLPRSGEKIYPYYRDYTEMSDVEMRELCDNGDDFLDQDSSPVSKSHNFSYGSSPGFKFKG